LQVKNSYSQNRTAHGGTYSWATPLYKLRSQLYSMFTTCTATVEKSNNRPIGYMYVW